MSARSKKLLSLALGESSDSNKNYGNKQVRSDVDESQRNSHRQIKQTIEVEHNGNPELFNESDKYFAVDKNQILGDKDDRKSTSSELDETTNLIAQKMEEIIGNILSESDDNNISKLAESPQQRSRLPSSELDNFSLFEGDFSDDDPTYHPVGSQRAYTSDSDNDENLITLRDLLGSNKTNDAGMPSQEPPPGPSWPMDIDPVNASDVISTIITDILDLVWSRVKPLSRWRTAKPDTWKRNVAKKRRTEGLPYVTNKQFRPAKVPKTVDCSKCMFKCTDAFTLKDREALCRIYWDLDFVGKKNFILTRLKVQPPKRVLVARKRPRPYITKCYFDMGIEQRQVCQKFFCATLKISPSVIKDAVKNRDSYGVYSNNKDPRGSREPPNKTSEARVKDVVDHINSFPTMEGHYVRKQSKRKYLDCKLTIPKMYALYLKKFKENPVSEMTYRRIFAKEFNLSFFVPKKDQCLTCNKYNTAHEQRKIDLETCYKEHIERKIVCTNEKENDKRRAEIDKNFVSVSFDLQAILQIPCSMIGILFFVRKLTLYNLCIYESALPNNAYCFPWSEVHGKKGSAEIGTILLHYLSNCVPSNVTEVSLFSDTCSGQNRNQYVTAILLWAVNTIENFQVIEQKFLESGHSYMEADSMHSSIESAKKHADVFSITDWINIFKKARTKAFYYSEDEKIIKPPYQVKEFKYQEFYDLKGLSETMIKNKTKDNDGNKVNWLKIKRMKYVKDDRNIYFNYDMSSDFLSFDTRPVQIMTPQSGPRTRKGNRKSNPNSVEPLTMEEFRLPALKRLYDKPLPISAAKKKDLLSLCEKGIIPEEYHGWFQSLTCDTDVVDRVPDVAVSESSSDEE